MSRPKNVVVGTVGGNNTWIRRRTDWRGDYYAVEKGRMSSVGYDFIGVFTDLGRAKTYRLRVMR